MNEIPAKNITLTSGSPSCRISTIWENQGEDFISLGESFHIVLHAGNTKMIMFMGNHLLLYQFIFVSNLSVVRKYLSQDIKEVLEAFPIFWVSKYSISTCSCHSPELFLLLGVSKIQ